LAVFFFYQWALFYLKKKAAINKAPLLGVVDAHFPVIAHHRCAHDPPCTVWAPHRAHQSEGATAVAESSGGAKKMRKCRLWWK
jgi:hypothetical protein